MTDGRWPKIQDRAGFDSLFRLATGTFIPMTPPAIGHRSSAIVACKAGMISLNGICNNNRQK
jgi:hypothetical protein